MRCLFCGIVCGHVPATVLFENQKILAFRDVNPQAPTHILIIPKHHISTLNEATDHDQLLLGQLLITAKNLAYAEQFSEQGYRLVINTNAQGGQAVYHIHLHLLGGRQMTWPAG